MRSASAVDGEDVSRDLVQPADRSASTHCQRSTQPGRSGIGVPYSSAARRSSRRTTGSAAPSTRSPTGHNTKAAYPTTLPMSAWSGSQSASRHTVGSVSTRRTRSESSALSNDG